MLPIVLKEDAKSNKDLTLPPIVMRSQLWRFKIKLWKKLLIVRKEIS